MHERFFWKDDPSNGRCNQACTITCTASPEALPAPSREVPPAVHCVNTNAAEHTQIADCVDENILMPGMLTIVRCRGDWTFLVCAPAPPGLSPSQWVIPYPGICNTREWCKNRTEKVNHLKFSHGSWGRGDINGISHGQSVRVPSSGEIHGLHVAAGGHIRTWRDPRR